VQLYVRDEASRLVRPLQELKAFAKVHLEPGETQTVTLTLTGQSLAYYDPAGGGWLVEPGDFAVRVGSSSRDIRLHGRFTWVDETAVAVKTNPDPRQLSTVAT
jgi:beta-glucosidase